MDSFVIPNKEEDKEVWRQCHHCYLIRKKKNWDTRRVLGKEFLECECSKNKADCEKLLVERNILGKELEHFNLKSLSDKEWFKLDHVMSALFGYNTSWSMDKDIMIAGLEAKLIELTE